MKKPWRYHGECCASGGPAAKTLGACGPLGFGLRTSLGTTFTMIPHRLFQIMSHCILQVSDHREEVVERVVTAGGVKDAGLLAARHGEEALEAVQGWGQGRQVGLGWLEGSMPCPAGGGAEEDCHKCAGTNRAEVRLSTHLIFSLFSSPSPFSPRLTSPLNLPAPPRSYPPPTPLSSPFLFFASLLLFPAACLSNSMWSLLK